MKFLLPFLLSLSLAAQPVKLEPTTYDFGQAVAGQKLRHDFSLTNLGKATIYITRLESSCGCTTVAPTKTLLVSGESTTFEVVLDTKGLSGGLAKTVDIFTETAQKTALPPIRIRLQAVVAHRLRLAPAVATFQNVSYPESREAVLRLEALEGPVPAIKSARIEGLPGCLEASPAVSAGGPAVRVEFDSIRIPPGAQKGQAHLHIETSDASEPHVFAPVEWSINAPIRALPERAAFFVQHDQVLTPKVVIGLKHMDGKPFRILSLEIPAWVRFEVAPGRAGGPLHTVVLSLAPDAPRKERYSGTISFLTDALPPSDRITIPLFLVVP